MRKPRNRKPRPEYHAFVFTKHTSSSIKYLLDKLEPHCLFAIAGLEVCPTTKKLHIQGYFYLKNPRTKGMVRKLFPSSHIEPARESPELNFLYCSKENSYSTIGSLSQAVKSWTIPPLRRC